MPGDHIPDQRRKPDATREQAKRKRRYESRGQGKNQIEIVGGHSSPVRLSTARANGCNATIL
jgi:hypothetical protein